MQIFVSVAGSPEVAGRVLTLEVDGLMEVRALKGLIQEAIGVPPQRQRLIFGNKLGGAIQQLADARTLRDYNVEKETTLQLALLPLPKVVELNVGGAHHTTLHTHVSPSRHEAGRD